MTAVEYSYSYVHDYNSGSGGAVEYGPPSELSCRLCLTPCHEIDENISAYAELYSQTTEFAIYANDVPKKICPACKDELLAASSFRQKCKTTEAQLAMLNQNFDIEIDFEPAPEPVDGGGCRKSEEFVERRGRPRVNPPKAKGPVGRPKGTTKDKLAAKSPPPPPVKRLSLDSSQGSDDALNSLRRNLPGAGRHGRPKNYVGDGEQIICHICGRVFLEAERKNMYNHMFKHRQDAKKEAQTVKEEETITVVRPPQQFQIHHLNSSSQPTVTQTYHYV